MQFISMKSFSLSTPNIIYISLIIHIEKVSLSNRFYLSKVVFFSRSDHRCFNDDSHRESKFLHLIVSQWNLFVSIWNARFSMIILIELVQVDWTNFISMKSVFLDKMLDISTMILIAKISYFIWFYLNKIFFFFLIWSSIFQWPFSSRK